MARLRRLQVEEPLLRDPLSRGGDSGLGEGLELRVFDQAGSVRCCKQRPEQLGWIAASEADPPGADQSAFQYYGRNKPVLLTHPFFEGGGRQ